MSLSACNSQQAERNEAIGEAVADNIQAQADNLSEAADEAPTDNAEAALENAADNMQMKADNAEDAADSDAGGSRRRRRRRRRRGAGDDDTDEVDPPNTVTKPCMNRPTPACQEPRASGAYLNARAGGTRADRPIDAARRAL